MSRGGSASTAAAVPHSWASTIGQAAPAIASWALPFTLVLYLALRGGGFDEVVRSEAGIAIWWLLLLGIVLSLLPVARIPRTAWLGLGVLAAFAVWMAIGIGGSESVERTTAELSRVALYLGVLTIALAAQGRDGLRHSVNAIAAAIVLVAGAALLSRLLPSLLPGSEVTESLAYARARLGYPLDDWNGLAALIAIGLPLVAVVGAGARSVRVRAFATAALPMMVLTIFFTLSRGGAVAAALGLIVMAALHSRRVELLPTLLLAGIASAVLVGAASQREALTGGLDSATATSQGHEMLALVLGACLGVGLMAAGVEHARRRGLLRLPEISRRQARRTLLVTALTAIVITVAVGVPGKLSSAWNDFKKPEGVANSSERLASVSGNGRYEYWVSAIDAFETSPVTGIGAGTFEFWWSRNRTLPGSIRDTHSLYLETLGERLSAASSRSAPRGPSVRQLGSGICSRQQRAPRWRSRLPRRCTGRGR